MFWDKGIINMTLKELVAIQDITGASDISIIKEFFTQNDMEEEAIKMIAELSEYKVSKLNQHIYMIKTWASWLPSGYLYENYDLKTATKLHNMELNYLAYNCQLSNEFLEWARENVPKIKMPEVYFQPLIQWLDDQGIKFAEKGD